MMSKNVSMAASVDLGMVRNFSFLTLLVMGIYLLFSFPAFADPVNECDLNLPISDCKITQTFDDGSTLTTIYDTNGVQVGTPTSTDCTNGCTAGTSSSTTAASNTTLKGVASIICDVVYLLIFDIGRGIATLSIIAVGVAAMFGKATWTQAVTVGVGIGIIFGALTLTTFLTANLTSIIGLLSSIPCIPSIP